MATNDEIREQENRQMAHYKNLTLDEQADRERSLMDKARSDTADSIFAELEAIKDEYSNPLLDTLYGKGRQYAKVKMKYTNKSVLCKNCHKPIYYFDGTWYHLSDGNGQCETPITDAEPDEALIK